MTAEEIAMTEEDVLKLVARLGAKMYDPAIYALVVDVAKRIHDGEILTKEMLPWPLSLY